MFSLRFVGTTCHSRKCMKMGKHDRTQFRTIGCTNFWIVLYLSPIIYFSGSIFLSNPKTPVIATEINCIPFVLTATSKSLPKLPSLGLQKRAVPISGFPPTFHHHFTFPSYQQTERSSDVTFCLICSISQSKLSHRFKAAFPMYFLS